MSAENHSFNFYSFSLCVTHSLSIPGKISIYFAVKKFVDGQHLLMESNFLFRPSVELLFYDGNATISSVACPISDTRSSPTTRQGCFTMKCNEGYSRSHASGAKIVTKIYFNRNSILFQVCITLRSTDFTSKLKRFEQQAALSSWFKPHFFLRSTTDDCEWNWLSLYLLATIDSDWVFFYAKQNRKKHVTY